MNDHISKFKTQPLKHQAHYLIHYAGREYFALLCEQGTGKSWMAINEMAQLWEANKIDCVIILAPNGVHENWTRPVVGQIPQHMPDWVNYKSIAWTSSKAQWAVNDWQKFKSDKSSCLKIYAFNWEALQHERSLSEFESIAKLHEKIYIILDESDAMKDPDGLRAKALKKLKKLGNFKFRRISTGTPINNAPFDAFSQFRFLDESILGTKSYRAFKAEYAEMLPPSHGLIKGIVGKKAKLDPVQERDLAVMFDTLYTKIKINGRMPLIDLCVQAMYARDSDDDELFVKKLDELYEKFDPAVKSKAKDECISLINGIKGIVAVRMKKMKIALNPNRIPQIVDKDKKTGLKKFRNLDKLNKLIAPHSYRVLRSECLDLPEKIYETLFFYLTPEQAEVYKKAENKYRLEFEGHETAFSKLTIATKLAQITSGYYNYPGKDDPVRIAGRNPKLEMLLERIEHLVSKRQKAIIWARHTAEINDISDALNKLGISNAKYYGKTKKKERLNIIDEFQNTKDEIELINAELVVWSKKGLDVFIGNAKAGGTGITLTAANSVHYYSNTFSYRDRKQSEDRAMRIGQTKDVIYYNYAAIGTIDEHVIYCLMNKQDVSFEIVDKGRELFSMGNKLLTA